MGILSALGVGGAVVKPLAGVLDDLFTSEEEKLDKKALLLRIEQKPALAQVAINRDEARHSSIFVAGWRPAVGWTCAVGLLWHFVLVDMVAWSFHVWKPDLPPPPHVSGIDELINLLVAMLGLAGLRSWEKMKLKKS